MKKFLEMVFHAGTVDGVPFRSVVMYGALSQVLMTMRLG